jgi:hypothetical protein
VVTCRSLRPISAASKAVSSFSTKQSGDENCCLPRFFRTKRGNYGCPERFAQQALGHNSKAVHHAYAKHAEVTVPSLDDWEKDWQENPQRSSVSKFVSIDLLLPVVATAHSN